LTATGGGTYNWSGSDGFTSTSQNPTIAAATLAKQGVYTVTVTNNGCTATASVTIVVNTMSATATVAPICEGGDLAFTSTPSGAVSYAWTGVNSFTSSLQNPTITSATAANAGAYTVVITDANGCSASATTTAVINNTPSATAAATTVCAGGTVQLQSSGGAFAWAWTGPNGFTSTDQNPVISNAIVSQSGTYNVTVTGAGTCVGSANVLVTINPSPTTAITAPSIVCNEKTLSLSATGGVSYVWSGPNAFVSSAASPVISPVNAANAGTYFVTATDANGCTAVSNKVVAVNAPIATANVTSPVCEGGTVNFTATGGATYSWSGPNLTTTTQNPSFGAALPAHAGIYSVTVTDAATCSATTQVILQVNSVNVTASVLSTCENDPIYLSASGNAGASYAWAGPNGFTSTQQNPIIAAAVTASFGTYTVTISKDGCTKQASKIISEDPTCLGFDYGDLPDPTSTVALMDYQTLATYFGAAHRIIIGLQIGDNEDAETTGQPNLTATGDGADEDGLATIPTITPGNSTIFALSTTNLTGEAANLYGFIDWNADGDFNDIGETATAVVPDGTNDAIINLTFNVPVNAAIGVDLGARFRLSTSALAAAPIGTAPNGEVEDYVLRLSNDCSFKANVLVGDCFDSNGNTAGGTSQANVSVILNWNMPVNDSILVVLGGVTKVIDTDLNTSPAMVTFTVAADGAVHNNAISAAFVGNTTCDSLFDYTAPTGNCVLEPCTSGTGGLVWKDFDNDGIKDAGETVGEKGIIVRAYDCNGNLVETDSTDYLGQYTFTTLTYPGNYRLEFVRPNGSIFPASNGTNSKTDVQFVSAAGCTNSFGVNNPQDYCHTSNPRISVPCFAIGDPLVAGAASTTSAIATVNYDGTGKSGDENAAIVGSTFGHAYNRLTKKSFLGTMLKRHVGLGTGATGNGSDLGAVYVFNHVTSVATYLFSVPNAGTVLSNSARGLTGNPTTPTADPSVFNKIGKVGLGGMEISDDNKTLYIMNLNDKKVYVYDLTAYNTSGNPTDIGAAVTTINTPNPGCTNGVTRPFALKYREGKLFIGLICDASSDNPVFDTRLTPGFESLGAVTSPRNGTANLPNGQTPNFDRRNIYGPNADLKAFIYTLDGANSFAATEIWNQKLDERQRGAVESYWPNIQYYQPWNDDWTKHGRDDLSPLNTNSGRVNYPAPILADIEIDVDGSIIATIMDRSGLQYGSQNLYPDGTGLGGATGILPAYVTMMGRTIRIAKVGSGYSTEFDGSTTNGGGCGLGEILANPATNPGDVPNAYPSLGQKTTQKNIEGFGFGSNDLISATNGTRGGGEYYCGDFISVHPNTTIGGLTFLPGTGKISIAAYDPITYNEGGIIWMNNATGQRSQQVSLYSGSATGGNSKGVGLGDMELICNAQPIEIGNYVWLDTDKDGVQDPCEPALDSVIVSLYTKTGVLVGKDTTDTFGNYFFNEKNVVDTLGSKPNILGPQPSTQYYIVLGKETSTFGGFSTVIQKMIIGSKSYQLTTLNTGEGVNPDQNDSEAALLSGATGVATTLNGYPAFCAETPAAGANHTFDFGLITPPCEITLVAIASDCFDSNGNTAGGTSVASVNVIVNWANAPLGETITVSVAGAADQTINPAIAISPKTLTFQIAADGVNHTVSSVFSTTTTCTASQNINAPVGNCVLEPCASGNTGGTVWKDINNNGTKDVAETVGEKSIIVRAYDCNGNLLETDTTDYLGQYIFTTLTYPGNYRLEFVRPNGSLFPSGAGVDNGTDVQFVSAAACDIDYGVNNPVDYCQPNPRIIVGCFVNGDVNTIAPVDAIVSWEYNATGTSGGNKAANASKSQVGSIWGMAYSKTRKKAYAAAFLRRQSGLASGGLGGIYLVDPTTGSMNGTLYTTIPNAGSISSNAVRGLGVPSAHCRDLDAFGKVGRVGLGDMEISDDESKLYVVNLFSKKIYVVNVDNPTQMDSISIPDLGCTGGVMAPFGLKLRDGKLYVGTVCDGSISGLEADIKATVWSFDVNNLAIAPTMTLSFPLNYQKGPAWNEPYYSGSVVATGESFVTYTARWHTWKDVYTPIGFNTGTYNVDSKYSICSPSPMLSDLEFDEKGNLILGFSDRTALQFFTLNQMPVVLTPDYLTNVVSGGDILRATNTNGVLTIEPLNKAAVPNATVAEFFTGEQFSTSHYETAQGGLIYVLGKQEVVTTALDPIGFYTGGTIKLNALTGAKTSGFEVYAGNLPLASKGVGLSDLEPICAKQPIEVGNYVWLDLDRDGTQDPCEPALDSVIVSIYKKDGTLIGKDTTNAFGNYYFDETNVDTIDYAGTPTTGFTGLTPNTPYIIVFGKETSTFGGFLTTLGELTIGSKMYKLTDSNSGEGITPDQNDSDMASLTGLTGGATMLNGFPGVCFTSPDKGSDHTFDFGLKTIEKVALGNLVFMDTNNDGNFDAGTDMPLNDVIVWLFKSGDDPAIATPTAKDTTSNGGFYLFDQLEAGQYFVFIPASEFATGEPLFNKISSTPEGGDTATDDNTDENGQNTPVSGGIQSGVIDLQPNAEPTSETGAGTYTGLLDDNNVNLTVDFGFQSEKVALGNLVFMDTNNDGNFDAGTDMALNDVIVWLFKSGDNPATATPTAKDTTSNGGFYLFDQLEAGQYFVFIPASEFATGEPLFNKISSSPQGGDTVTDDNTDENGQNTPVSGGIQSGVIDLQPNAEPTSETGAGTYTGLLDDNNVNLTVDFGFQSEKVALGNLVFMDTNNDGNFDAGTDMPLNDVIVWLFKSSDDPATATPTAKDTTSGGGFYLFDQLDEGQYFVFIPASEFTTVETLFNKISATPEGGDTATDDNSDENGQNTLISGGVSSGIIDLLANAEPTSETGAGTYTGTLDDNNVNMTVDFGFRSEKVALGNLVFMDTNADSKFTSGTDMALDNVIVWLFKSGDDPATATPTAKDTTSGGGFYLFDQLDAGQYFVFIPASEFATGETLVNKISATPEGGDTATDDNGDENGQNTPISGGIASGVIDLQPNAEPISETGAGTYTGTLDDNNVNMTVDFGFRSEKVALGNLVFMDTNADSKFTSGTDMALDNVIVWLFKSGDDPATATPTAKDTTSGGGFYLFDQLDAGQYFVFIPASEFATGKALNNKVSASAQGGDIATDDNGDENGQNTPISGGIASGVIDLQPNAEPTSETGAGTYTGLLDDNNVNMTVDFGFRSEKVALGNLVFMDTNADIKFTSGTDMALDNVIVWLFKSGENPATATPTAKDTTSGGGFYLFDQLDAGQYFVFIPASEFATGKALNNKVSTSAQGGDTTTDDNSDENGQNTPVSGGIASGVIDLQPNAEPTSETGAGTYTGTLDDNNVNMTVDFGFRSEKVALGNLVFMDTNADSKFTSGTDMALDNVIVWLFKSGDDPATATPTAKDTTSGGGFYLFDQLDAGQYFVFIPASEFATGKALNNKVSASAQGGDTTTDDNGDENGQNTPVSGGIASGVIDLQPNAEPTSETGAGTYTGTLDDNNVNMTVDFGFRSEKVALGNLVFMDTNADSKFTSGTDMTLDNVIVWLFKSGDDPATATPTAKDTTSGGGFYLFDQLDAGQYFVFIPASEFAAGKALNNKVSASAQGGDTTTDDNGDENGQNTPVSGGIASGVIDLQPNAEPTSETGAGTYTGTLDDNNVNMTVDFGFKQLCTTQLVLAPDPMPDGYVNVPYSVQVTATGGNPPYNFIWFPGSAGGQIPDGLTMDATGLVSGTPTSAGSFGVAIVGIDALVCPDTLDPVNIVILNQFDYGDVPSTFELGTPANHKIVNGLRMGATVDAETVNHPVVVGTPANGDDLAGTPDDEDGVANFPTLTTNLNLYQVQVAVNNTTSPAAAAVLVGWIDFDGNGTFEADEAATMAVPASTTGNVTLTFTPTADISIGTRYARFRLAQDATLTAATPTAAKANGEVEDYALPIIAPNCPAVICVPIKIVKN
jgi:SdrD B-like domain/GEVED domain